MYHYFLAPSAPIIRVTRPMGPTTVYVAWYRPIEINGEMETYRVKYYKNGEPESSTSVVPTTALEINITGLEPSTTYNIFVTASTEVAEGGPSGMMIFRTGIEYFFLDI